MYKISKELQIKDEYEKDTAELAFKVLEMLILWIQD